jgi:hypothetical protein
MAYCSACSKNVTIIMNASSPKPHCLNCFKMLHFPNAASKDAYLQALKSSFEELKSNIVKELESDLSFFSNQSIEGRDTLRISGFEEIFVAFPSVIKKEDNPKT